jgi:hypothetical protein
MKLARGVTTASSVPLLLQSGRVRPSLEASSVLVRLMCGSRQGQLEAPAWSLPLPELRLPRCALQQQQQQQHSVRTRNSALHDAARVLHQGSSPALACAWTCHTTGCCPAVCRYVVAELGPRFVAEMRKMIRNKTYSMVRVQQQQRAFRVHMTSICMPNACWYMQCLVAGQSYAYACTHIA